jgi:hypothetical protein
MTVRKNLRIANNFPGVRFMTPQAISPARGVFFLPSFSPIHESTPEAIGHFGRKPTAKSRPTATLPLILSCCGDAFSEYPA